MPNWTKTNIRLIGEKEAVGQAMKLIVVTDEYVKKAEAENFDLCEHVRKSPCFDNDAEATCMGCAHDGYCPLLSTDGRRRSVSEYGRLNELKRKYKDGDVLFDILVPQPTGMFYASTNKAVESRNAKFGITDWHDWNVKHWGTKWNASETAVQWTDEGMLLISFWTANGFPRPWMEKLAAECAKLGVSIEGEFADEDAGGEAGTFSNTPDGCGDGYADEDDGCLMVDADFGNPEIWGLVWGEDPSDSEYEDCG